MSSPGASSLYSRAPMQLLFGGVFGVCFYYTTQKELLRGSGKPYLHRTLKVLEPWVFCCRIPGCLYSLGIV